MIDEKKKDFLEEDAGYKRHGGPYDRGSADSYYQRGFEPHYFVGDTYSTEKVKITDVNSNAYRAYKQGYDDNERAINFKKWD